MTYPHGVNAVPIDAFLDLSKHTLKMPPNQVPANTEHKLLLLCDHACCQSSKVAQISGVEEGV